MYMANKIKDEQVQGRTALGKTQPGDKGRVYHCANGML